MAEAPDPIQHPRRFYKAATVAPAEGGFAVQLDGRTPRSPARKPLVAPTEALAGLLAQEWDGQGEYIVSAAMPATRLAFTAIDRIPEARDETVKSVVAYAASDLLCYRAEGPSELVALEAASWDPLLDWARGLGVDLQPVRGIIHSPQPRESLEQVASLAVRGDDFALAGLAFAAGLFGSAILALALQHGRIDGEEAFRLSRVDDDFQIEQWGVDEEAASRARALRLEALWLERWFRALA